MGVFFLICNCINCRNIIHCNPDKVPSLQVNGVKEPLCLLCANEWNRIHRTSKGLAPVPIHPDAYDPCPEDEF